MQHGRFAKQVIDAKSGAGTPRRWPVTPLPEINPPASTMNLSNLTVRGRLMAAFALMTALLITVAFMSLRGMREAQERFAAYVGGTAARAEVATALRAATNARALSARNLVLVTTPADRAAEMAAVEKAHQAVASNLALLKAELDKEPRADERERKLFGEVQAIEARYGPVAQAILKLVADDQRELAISKMNLECRPLLAALLKATFDMKAVAKEAAGQELQQAESAYASSRNLAMGVCALIIALAAGLALLITGGIARSLGAEPHELSAALQRVADGDLSPVAGAERAPPGSVLATLARMQERLAGLVGQVRLASDSIATAAAQIASGNADLSNRTEQQASSLQQTAASMEEMNATVKNNADTARQATQLSGSASAVAEQGGEVVTRVIATMDDITNSSKRIADIIGVIDGIAFQTNILALNAAVEAARAGEQGRGFAVVAGEVRNLAQRSAEAAREIKGLIGSSVEKVEAGARLVGDAGVTMTDIVTQVKRVSDLISEISAATIEQTSGIGQVNQAVALLDQSTQQNAALVEQSAAAADSLRQQALALSDVVSVFRLQAV